MDLRTQRVLTIDDASTREIDDGLSVEALPGGGHRLWVHIADPSRWVAPGSPLECAARDAVRTLYLPTGASLVRPAPAAVRARGLALMTATVAGYAVRLR